ncbi:hypothetical protein VTN00DRAFT_3542 [Thermoascus crustaceus]|uniref:uncharacterized protein n=1 Tax=Thermoascus crustaceus TaxID=5088 RepID=UPI0037421688
MNASSLLLPILFCAPGIDIAMAMFLDNPSPEYLEENLQPTIYGLWHVCWRLDDGLVVAAYILCILFIGPNYALVLPLIYMASVVPSKLVILSLYLSGFTTDRICRVLCYGSAAIIIANWIGCSISGFVSCVPLKLLWMGAANGHCFNVNAWYRWSGFSNIMTDLVMLVLPTRPVLGLYISTRMKADGGGNHELGSHNRFRRLNSTDDEDSFGLVTCTANGDAVAVVAPERVVVKHDVIPW